MANESRYGKAVDLANFESPWSAAAWRRFGPPYAPRTLHQHVNR